MNANVLINSFNTGEISGLCESRSDLAKFASACRTLENAIPLVEGGAKKMPGTYFAGVTAHGGPIGTASTGKSRLVPFQFSTDQGAVLEFSAGIVRIWEGATEGSWSLGLALQAAGNDYDPSTAYVPGDVVLVGPYALVSDQPSTHPTIPPVEPGSLYIAAPYGTSNASTVQITFSTNTSDSLSVTKTGTSPSQGINISLANTTPSNNAASIIQSAIRALGSLNSPSYNYVNLSSWTVTPDTIYYSHPWIFAPRLPTSVPETTYFAFTTTNWIMKSILANQYDQFPWAIGGTAAYWEDVTATDSPIELVTPYAESDLFDLDCSTQSADVLWVFHPSYPPGMIQRLTSNSWKYSLTLPNQQTGEPAYRGTLDVVKTGYSALGQNISLISQTNPAIVVLTSSSQPFSDGDRIYINKGSGMVDLNEGEFLVSGIAYGTPAIKVVDSAGTVSTVTPSSDSWYMNLLDPSTGDYISTASSLQYTGGAFATKVVAMFAAAGDYPACGTLYQERLCVGGSNNNPTQINGSTQDDYPDFICDPNEDDYAIQYTLVANKLNQLLNMVGTPNGLAIGTAGGIWIVVGSSTSSLSQTNVDATLQSGLGVSEIQPQLVSGSAIFVSRSSRIVTFLAYNFVTNSWDNTDLTRINRNITIGTSSETSGIAQTAFQMEPYPIFWAVRNDGQLIGLVFNTQDQVYAWFRVKMDSGLIESVAVVTGKGQEDQVAIVVNRTINGVTQRYVEYFMPQELFGQLSNSFFVHCGLQWKGAGPFSITGITQAVPAVVTSPGHTLVDGQKISIADVLGMTQVNTNPLQAWTVEGVSGDTFQLQGSDSTAWEAYTGGGTIERVTNQVTGMSYLMGQNVTAVGDEQVIFTGIVTSDIVVLGSYANQITIGVPYTSTIEPMNPVLGDQKQTSKSKRQKFTRVNLSMYESVGGLAGTDSNHLYRIDYTQGTPNPLPPESPATLFTGNVINDLDSEWTDEGTIKIVHSDPFPMTLRSVTPRLSVAEEG